MNEDSDILEVCALASGSNGNCYYIGNNRDAILVDAGISCKQILKRMDEKYLDTSKIKALFISHEHSDHIRGARVFAKRLHVPVYMTAKTFVATYKNLQPDYPRYFDPGDVISVGDFTIHSFLKNHDASEPCSFRIAYQDKNVGVFTDIGAPCENVKSHFQACDVVFLESNYDEEMLLTGPYPWYLKKRIASTHGHLSNLQASSLLDAHGGVNLKCVFLSHLSAHNNTPELALKAFESLTSRIEVRITYRDRAGELLLI
ncbi:MAG: MBL fold metallo-hydrolase [Mariniphaga sp.]